MHVCICSICVYRYAHTQYWSFIGCREIHTNIKFKTFYLLSLLLSSIAIVVIVTVFQRIDIALILLGYIISNLSISYLLGKKLFQKYLIQTLLQKSLLITLGIGFFYIFGTDGILYAIGISYLGYAKVLYDSFKTSKKQRVMEMNS